MKILEGSFQCEVNTFSSQRTNIKDFEILQGDELLEKMAATPVFQKAKAQVVPLLYASALPGGMVTRNAFEHFKRVFIEEILKEKNTDGIYLYLHGSMYVEDLGSGEEWLVRAVREAVGKSIPISVALDYHANLSDGFIQNVNAIQGFRTAPHTDHDETERRAAEALLKCIRHQICPIPKYVRVPFLGGDAATTDKEPFLSITKHLERLDLDNEIISCAFFNGQPWYDSAYTGNCAVVSGMKAERGKREAARLAKIFWEGKEYLRIQNAMPVEEAVTASLENKEGVLFVTDSGDNTTAGANGKGTLLLREYMKRNREGVLVCGIFARDTTDFLLTKQKGETTEITLCKNRNQSRIQNPESQTPFPGACLYENKQEIETICQVTLKQKGIVYGWTGEKAGEGVLVKCGNTDIILTNARAAFTTPGHFKEMGIEPAQYRVIVLKMGYLFPKLEEISKRFIFALTPGTSSNDFAQIDYKRINKKMYPIDTDITWEDILKETEVGV